MRRALVVCLLLQGCNIPEVISSHGAFYYFWKDKPAWDPSEIDEEEDWFLRALNDVAPDRYPISRTAPKMVGLFIHVYPTHDAKCSATNCIVGSQQHNVISLSTDNCPFYSPLPHELMHYFQEALYAKDDYLHQEPDVWKLADSAPRECP